MIKVSQNPMTARTLYNKKDVFGVKHGTQNESNSLCWQQWMATKKQSFQV